MYGPSSYAAASYYSWPDVNNFNSSNNGRDANIQKDVPSESRLAPVQWGTGTIE